MSVVGGERRRPRATTTTAQEPQMIIVAKFASVCPCCSTRIVVGSKVEWSRGEKARHEACVSPSVVSPRRRGGPTGARRYASGAGSAAPVAGYSSWCTAQSGCGCFDCAS